MNDVLSNEYLFGDFFKSFIYFKITFKNYFIRRKIFAKKKINTYMKLKMRLLKYLTEKLDLSQAVNTIQLTFVNLYFLKYLRDDFKQQLQFLYISIKEGEEVLDITNNNIEEVKHNGGFIQTMVIVQIIGVRVTMVAIKSSEMGVEMVVHIKTISEAIMEG